ncbi:GGDEF domain-containing protein [Niveibacterium sp. 24ML]|uniref:GGDEF domain-containing protein n=1 Tax=Niveibacterium sp. 24ML TaxID=2985512 RepID=UPI0022704557|nr:GGDEF domain-containing protein [Niveibacterium sp. 24ML]MCX9155246.1 GGDEF domain-containing protein [Niveibacterium sp. 24ML]
MSDTTGLARLAAGTDQSMLKLLGQVRAMSSSRDREQMTLRLVTAMRDVLGAREVKLYAVSASPHGPVGAVVAVAAPDREQVANEDEEHPPVPLHDDPFLDSAIRSSDGVAEIRSESAYRLALAMGDTGNPHALLVADCDIAPEPRVRDAFLHVAHFYQNQLDLLDYAELDTLTKLLNRKTFDENFDRFIASVGRALQTDSDRRNQDDLATRPSWMGVIDIDRFKRINDNFGHLFGDEVLLRVAEVMRSSFRQRDKLFRFGGEEFVVLLRNVSEPDARAIFERFRTAVESHEFPQVGQVTASAGFTQIDPTQPPAEMLGHADEALYFSKQNGRNQVNSYEDLVARGLLEGPKPAAGANTELQADIDALFD